jgi:hypothetical protein
MVIGSVYDGWVWSGEVRLRIGLSTITNIAAFATEN